MQELKKYFITINRDYKEGDVAVFRQKFSGENVVSAVLFSTALRVYEAELNGKKVGKQMFAPGYTYYPRRVLYQKNDVTGLLAAGRNSGEENELVFYLGQGWYCGRFLCENKTQIYGEKPAISWILELKFADGSEKMLHSGTDAEELESPYEYAGEYDGEVYFADGRKNVIGHPAAFTGTVDFALEKTLTEVRVQEEMPVKSVAVSGEKTILDFGQNFAGIVEIHPEFLGHEMLAIRHGEILNPDGSLYTANLRKAKAAVIYHAGAEKKVYRPRFTYMGFRYMELSGAEYKPGMVKAYALYTDMARTGFFECGHEKVQKLYENQVWGQKSNYVEVPTDCPQRDERMGYTGDGQVFALTGAYNFDTNDFWKNFLCDLELGQLDNSEGYVCATVPQTGPGGHGHVSRKPYIEGAWMDKYQGRYYLQYACTGAEYNVYSDGVYVGDSPLGSFTLADNNPYSYKPGGFLPGAGHGSTMRDRQGNLWHASTMRISKNHVFERRVGIWPAGFDADGELFCNQRYGDWPMEVEDGKMDPWKNPQWYLLSYGKPVKASSFTEGKEPKFAADENVQTWWRSATAEGGEWIQADLEKIYTVNAVQVNFADDGINIPVPGKIRGTTQARYIEEKDHATRWKLEGSLDGEKYFMIEDKSEADTDLPHDLIVRKEGIRARFLKLTVIEVPYGQPPCISGLRIFGKGDGEKPEIPEFEAYRENGLDMMVKVKAKDAAGYNILWGSKPDKLYHSYMIFGNGQRIGALVKGKEYYVRVDAFNENGVTEGNVVKVAAV